MANAAIQEILKPTKYRAVDTSGNNNHGQIYSGRALEFDGVSDYLTSIDSYSNTTELTIAFWMNPDDLSGTEGLIGRNSGSAANGSFSVWFTSGSVRAYVGDGSVHYTGRDGGAGHDYSDQLAEYEIPGKSTWYRIAIVYNFTGKNVKIYANGQEVANKDYTLTTDTGADIVYIGALSSSNLYAGKLSDVQFWESAWTQSDVTFDYLNPESLALNNGGTSLTESNLKLWYPMQDGHRGQQSYIMDGANTGLGDELTTNADMNPDGGGWRFNNKWESGGGEGALDNVYVSTTDPCDDPDESCFYTTFDGKQCMYLKTIGPAGNEVIDEQGIPAIAGTTYKFHIRVWVVQGELEAYHSNNNWQDNVFMSSKTTGEWEDMVLYLTADNPSSTTSGWMIGQAGTGEDVECYIDFASQKAVNDKHHATTEFLGDNLITAANAVKLASDGLTADETDATTGWTNSTTSTFDTSDAVTAHTGSKSITFSPSGNGGRITTDLNDYLTVGRTYKLSIFARHGGSGDGAYIRLASNQGLTSDTTDLVGGGVMYNTVTTFTEYTATFVHSENTRYFGVKETGSNHNGTYYIDSFYVKEVGVASGWTDADQQLDIPQTALQSYNQLAFGLNGGTGNIHYVEADPEPDFGTADFSISYSVFFNDATETIRFYSAATATTVRQLANRLMRIYISDGAGNTIDWTTVTKADVFESGKWYHIVENWNYSGSDWLNLKVYVNGEFENGTELDLSSLDGSTGLNMQGAHKFGGYSNPEHLSGAMTEIAYWKGTNLSQDKINELYNDGKILDAREHSAASTYLIHYWRNNGLAQWKDLKGSAHSTNNYYSETLLLPAGVDASRDNQGFIMNRQKDTNALNLTQGYDGTTSPDMGMMYVDLVDTQVYDVTEDRSWSFWIKRHSAVGDAGIILGGADKNFQFIAVGNNPNSNARIDIESDTNTDTAYSANESIHSKGLDAWIHVVVVADAGAISIYIDGVKIAVTSSPIADDLSLRYVGSAQPTTNHNRSFDGQIDDLLIYDRVLTDGGVSATDTAKGEIARIYNAGKRSHRND